MKNKNTLIKISTLFILAFAFSLFADNVTNNANRVKVILYPIQEAVISSPVGAVLTSYNYLEGEHFKKGDIIASLDSSLYKESFEKASAQVAELKASYKHLKEVYDYNKTLATKDAISSRELAESLVSAVKAQSDLKDAEADMKIAQYNLDKCDIVAPYPGIIVSKKVNPNEYIATDEPIMKIINDSELLGVMNMPDDMLKLIKPKSVVKIQLNDGKTIISGSIYETSGTINPVSHTILVKVLIDNKDNKLMSGMSGYLVSIS